ncbi:MAG: MgtC/SapB family protein [Candidatus Velthaea sp.]|jgi:putative Mg2+ transporter-C (MgtC) family protein
MQAISTNSGLGAVSHVDFALRVFVALVFGALIGLERQWRQRLAGLRTNALVATGTSLFILITPLVGGTANPTQIAAYIVSGIGFLAGGVIFKERLSVSGLNTAATLWCTAAVGALAGFGFFVEAAVGVAAVLVANVVLRPVVRRINRQPLEGTEVVTSYEIEAICRQEVEERIRTTTISAIRGAAMSLIAVYSEDIPSSERVEITADVTVTGRADARLEKIVSKIGLESGVFAVSWKVVPTSDDERELLSDA